MGKQWSGNSVVSGWSAPDATSLAVSLSRGTAALQLVRKEDTARLIVPLSGGGKFADIRLCDGLLSLLSSVELREKVKVGCPLLLNPLVE